MRGAIRCGGPVRGASPSGRARSRGGICWSLSAVILRSARYWRPGSPSGDCMQAAVELFFGPGEEFVEGALVVLFFGLGADEPPGSLRCCRSWMPARSASISSASRNSRPSAFMMKLKTSPPMSQTQQRHDWRSGLTLQAGAAVVVPRAQADEVAALAAERDVAADQVDDVDGLANLLLGIECRAESHCCPPDRCSATKRCERLLTWPAGARLRRRVRLVRYWPGSPLRRATTSLALEPISRGGDRAAQQCRDR